ncbi:hypothetical protein SAMN05443661_12615 [Natronobacterium gregoryi]|uniref:Uncharacterized protein n=2 Tax=Natronobacterium gregoryi TaxID=44930 RepID=L0ALZ7_NATGS|nr:hypothetical protein Natgr_3824 [Natronobacterium gregoryi SP2]PLK19846.1 hypothetical protein CYV19_12600 [Natronobacterium gregoryi SP2]SFJ39105.1 hypothetical protein SAMN05443661_12615 [Natronobacterium gregoryi]
MLYRRTGATAGGLAVAPELMDSKPYGPGRHSSRRVGRDYQFDRPARALAGSITGPRVAADQFAEHGPRQLRRDELIYTGPTTLSPNERVQ